MTAGELLISANCTLPRETMASSPCPSSLRPEGLTLGANAGHATKTCALIKLSQAKFFPSSTVKLHWWISLFLLFDCGWGFLKVNQFCR